jgi:hypothetical protein
MAAPGGAVPILVDATICVPAGSLVDRYDYDYGASEMPNEGPLSTVCPIRTCPADSWSASGQDDDGSAGGCAACPTGSGIADRGGVRTNNTAAHAGAERCATGDAAVVVSAAGVPVCASGLLGAPMFSAALRWAGCAHPPPPQPPPPPPPPLPRPPQPPPQPPLPPAGGSVASVVSLRGIALASFDAVAVAGVLADLLGLQPAAVSATVQSFALSSLLSLAGGGASLTPAQQNAIASSVAASLPGVTTAQVALSGGAAAAHRRRRHLLQAPALQVGVTVSRLPADAVAATHAAALLTAPATLSALVASVAGSGITGATAAPVVMAAQLAIAVQVPASGSPGAVTAALSASGATSLATALQAAGVSTTGVTVVAAPLVAAPPPPPAPPSPPDVRGRIIGGVIGGVAGAALLMAAIVLAMRRKGGSGSTTDTTTDNMKDSSIRTDTTASPGDDGGGAWRTFLSSADEVVLAPASAKAGTRLCTTPRGVARRLP